MGYINFYFIPKHGVASFSCTISLGSSISSFPNLERLICAGWINQDAHAYPDQEYSNMSGMGGAPQPLLLEPLLKSQGISGDYFNLQSTCHQIRLPKKNFPPSWCTLLVINHSELDLQMDLTVFSMPGHNPVQHQHNAFLPLHNTEQ